MDILATFLIIWILYKLFPSKGEPGKNKDMFGNRYCPPQTVFSCNGECAVFLSPNKNTAHLIWTTPK